MTLCFQGAHVIIFSECGIIGHVSFIPAISRVEPKRAVKELSNGLVFQINTLSFSMTQECMDFGWIVSI
jgi:hypothetical protein